ncbi:MAG: hypothetical protein AAFW46_07970 [Pseudomonadota bacterium]
MELFSLEGVAALALLIALQAMLAAHNLLAIDIEARRAPPEDQANLRRLGVGAAVAFRLAILFVALTMLSTAGAPLFSLDWTGVIEARVGLGALLLALGGVLTLNIATREIMRLLAIEHLEADVMRRGQTDAKRALAGIALVNLLVSAAVILSSIALTRSFVLLAIATLASGVFLMLWADRAAELMKRDRMRQVFGLFALLVIGLLTLSQGLDAAALSLLGHEIGAIPTPTAYVSILVVAGLYIVQKRYRTKLLSEKRAELHRKI